MNRAGPLAEQAEALRGIEALAGDEAATLSLAPPKPPDVPPPPAPGGGDDDVGALGGHAAKGFAFMLGQALVTRVLGLACQIALARILIPEHFGLVALADTIATFAGLLQLIGVKEILVGRQKKFHLYANAAFWITIFAGLITGAVIAASGPLAARVFNEPDLPGLMLVLAISLPIWMFGLVPEARVQSQLRFKLLAGLVAMQATVTPLLTVALALGGFGPYSFVLPRIVVGLIRGIILFRAASLKFTRDFQFRRWKYIVSSSAIIFCTSLLMLIVQIGERPVLGVFVDTREVGLYFFAYSISLQTVMMISVNLEQVLFATLAKLQGDPARLKRAFLRASNTLASIVVPLCLIQSAVSDAAVRTVFGLKWLDAIPTMQILGIAMVFPAAYCPANAMLQAQQRFRTRFKLSLANALLYITSVITGVIIGTRVSGPVGGITGAAIGVSISMSIMNPIWSYITMRPVGGTWGSTFGIIARPLIAGGLAVSAGLGTDLLLRPWASGLVVRGIALQHWVSLFVIGFVSAAAYLPLMRALMPDEFSEVAAKVMAIVRRAQRAAGRGPEPTNAPSASNAPSQ